MSTTPAGWYPQADGRQRYWDGSQWTEHFAPGSAQQQASVATTAAAATSSRPWFKKKRIIIPAGVAGLIFIGSLGAGGDEPNTSLTASTPKASASTSAASPSATETTAAPTPSPTPTPAPAKATPAPKPTPKPTVKPKPPAPVLTVAQENAKGKAEDYLDYSGFSRKGLIEQLKFEGFSTKDIEAALATMKVNWKAEAAEKAEAYMSYSHFSRSGLISQLKFEGFTTDQAKYGAKSVGF